MKNYLIAVGVLIFLLFTPVHAVAAEACQRQSEENPCNRGGTVGDLGIGGGGAGTGGGGSGGGGTRV